MLKSAVAYFPSVILPRLYAFLTLVAGSHLLPPSQYGYFALVVIIGEAAEMAATNWVRIALVKFGSKGGVLGRSFALKMAKIAGLSSAVGILLAVALAAVLAPEAVFPVGFSVALYAVGMSSVRYGLRVHQAMDNRAIYSAGEAARSTASFFATVLLMKATEGFFLPSIAAGVVNLAAGIWLSVVGLSRTHPDLPDDTTHRELALYAFPLVLLALLSYAITSLDKAILKTWHDAATLAFYAAAFAVGRTGFDVVANAFNIGVFTRLASMQDEAQREEAEYLLSTQMTYLLAIFLPGAAVLVGTRHLLARLLFPPSYEATFVAAIPLIVVGAIAINLKNFVYDNVFHIRSKNLRQVPTLAAGAAVSMAVGFFLLPRDPATGAAAMFASGAIVSLVMSVLYSRPLMRVPIRWISLATSAAIAIAVAGGGRYLAQTASEVATRPITVGLMSIGALGFVASVVSLGCASASERSSCRWARARGRQELRHAGTASCAD